MSIPIRPLGIIKNLVEAVGLDISYVYEELIFIEHNAFLLQMSDTDGTAVGVWFNKESNPDDRPEILSHLQSEGRKLSLQVEYKGTYTLASQDGEDSFQLEFEPRD